MNAPCGNKLARFYEFFKMYNRERLNGLDASYFRGMNEWEREEAWAFMLNAGLNAECIIGLHLLDERRAVELFKKELNTPALGSPCWAGRREIDGSRLLMLTIVDDAEPASVNVEAMVEFSRSEAKEIRAQFARVVPSDRATPNVIDALLRMVLTETDTLALTCAIDKLMVICGRPYKYPYDDPIDREIYLALRSDDHMKKLDALRRLGVPNVPFYASLGPPD